MESQIMEMNIGFRAGLAMLCLSLAMLLSGCGTSMKLGSADNGMKVGELSMAELKTPVEHRLAPEDQIQVVAWDVPEFLSGSPAGGVRNAGFTYVVHADGTIDLPLLGVVGVGGLSVNEARRKVEDELRRFVKEPKVGLTVTSYNSRKILVLGEVTRPGLVLNPGPALSLAEALAQAGGSVPLSADTSNIYVIRGALDEPKVTRVPLDSAVAMSQAQHIWLQSRDVIFVNSQKITDWNRFMTQIFPSITDYLLLKSLGVVK
jgi:protein involved in polysaccharide export with SLBB domain